MSRLCFPTVALIMGLFPGLLASQAIADHPGYFPIEELGIIPEENLNLEINLTGPMMKFIALATDEEEPEFSRMVEGLESIRVRSTDLEDVDPKEIRAGIRGASRRLSDAGWESMVRMRDKEEEIYIYFREQDSEMAGLTVLSIDADEAMLINLVGKIDPAALGGLARGLDLPQLDPPVPDSGDTVQGEQE